MRRFVALLVALTMVGGTVAVPVVAHAAPAKSAAKKAKKKKAKKKKRKRSAAGAQGAPGPQGPAGPAGPAGPSGSTVVARARLAAPVTLTSNDGTPVPLMGAKWVQQADETDDFIGEATVTLPAECTVEGPGPTDDPIWWLEDQVYGGGFYVGGAWGELKLAEENLGYVDFPVFEEDAGRTVTRSFYIDRKLMEPGTPTEREVTLKFNRFCDNADATFTIQAVKLNVIGIR